MLYFSCSYNQDCGSGTVFGKRLDPDPDLNNKKFYGIKLESKFSSNIYINQNYNIEQYYIFIKRKKFRMKGRIQVVLQGSEGTLSTVFSRVGSGSIFFCLGCRIRILVNISWIRDLFNYLYWHHTVDNYDLLAKI